MSITSAIKSIQDIMRKDAGVDGDAQRLGQLSWLLFLKIFDAQEEDLEFELDNYKTPIPKKYLWRNWAADPEGITGAELIDFVNNELIARLKELPAPIKTNPRGYVVKEAFSDAFNYMKNGTLLRQVVNKLNEIDFTSSHERHQFGDLYEQILKDLQSAGNAGEFYTPRAVTRFIVQMINPQLGESVLDPALWYRRFSRLHRGYSQTTGKRYRGRKTATAISTRGREKTTAAPALHHQHDATRHRSTQTDTTRQHP